MFYDGGVHRPVASQARTQCAGALPEGAPGRNLAISEIVADTLEDMNLKLPPTQVDIAEIRRKYHVAAEQQVQRGH